VILQNYFRKLSFLKNKFVEKFSKNKTKFNVSHNFCCGSSRHLARSCNMWGRGGGGKAGSSYELDVLKKETFNDIFARRLLKTK
jgi:hypothetical protein